VNSWAVRTSSSSSATVVLIALIIASNDVIFRGRWLTQAVFWLERDSSSVNAKEPSCKNSPPLPASVLSSLTFCSGRNGGPTSPASKFVHPEDQRSSQKRTQVQGGQCLASKSFPFNALAVKSS
jgi:hypothetical protein